MSRNSALFIAPFKPRPPFKHVPFSHWLSLTAFPLGYFSHRTLLPKNPSPLVVKRRNVFSKLSDVSLVIRYVNSIDYRKLVL